MLKENDVAPEFTLADQNGEQVSLSDFRGRKVVLYFYPKDDTPGCTTQACDLRDNVQKISSMGATVLGVSTDSVDSHKKFRDKYGLNFRLLADEDHAVCEQYGVWAEKSMYGRKYWGALRATFVIDGSGAVVHVIPKVSPRTHDDEVLGVLERLAAA